METRLIEPRAWQESALEIWRERQFGVVEVVTGGGKTVFGLLCANHFLEGSDARRLIVVAPTVALVDQWSLAVAELGVCSQAEIAIHAGVTGADLDSARCHVMTLVGARTLAPRLSEANETMLLVDECHRIGSPANARALDGEYVATLGLSATPEREYDTSFESEVVPVLGDIFFRYTYKQALDDGIIAPFIIENIQVPLSNEEREAYDALSRRIGRLIKLKSQGEDVEEQIKRALRERASVSGNARSRVPVAVEAVRRHQSKRVIVFHERIDQAELIADALETQGLRVARYHSDLGPEMRRSELSLFRIGLVDVLVTCRALDEGLDVPETEVAVIASSTASKRQRIQRIGRALRPKQNGANATVITLFATRPERERLEMDEAGAGALEVTWAHAQTRDQ